MVINPKRILWPTDFSPLSLIGARYARGFADVFGSEVHVVHVVTPLLTPDFAVMLPGEVPTAMSEGQLTEACRASLKNLAHAELPDTKVQTGVLHGTSWKAICEYAEKHAIDMIIVPTHGRTGLTHVLIGSTAERIVQHAPCAVLVVKSTGPDFVVGG